MSGGTIEATASSRSTKARTLQMAEHICQWDDDCGFPARFKVRGGGIGGHYWFCAQHYDRYVERQHCSPAEAWKWDAHEGEERY